MGARKDRVIFIEDLLAEHGGPRVVSNGAAKGTGLWRSPTTLMLKSAPILLAALWLAALGASLLRLSP